MSSLQLGRFFIEDIDKDGRFHPDIDLVRSDEGVVLAEDSKKLSQIGDFFLKPEIDGSLATAKRLADRWVEDPPNVACIRDAKSLRASRGCALGPALFWSHKNKQHGTPREYLDGMLSLAERLTGQVGILGEDGGRFFQTFGRITPSIVENVLSDARRYAKDEGLKFDEDRAKQIGEKAFQKEFLLDLERRALGALAVFGITQPLERSKLDERFQDLEYLAGRIGKPGQLPAFNITLQMIESDLDSLRATAELKGIAWDASRAAKLLELAYRGEAEHRIAQTEAKLHGSAEFRGMDPDWPGWIRGKTAELKNRVFGIEVAAAKAMGHASKIDCQEVSRELKVLKQIAQIKKLPIDASAVQAIEAELLKNVLLKIRPWGWRPGAALPGQH